MAPISSKSVSRWGEHGEHQRTSTAADSTLHGCSLFLVSCDTRRPCTSLSNAFLTTSCADFTCSAMPPKRTHEDPQSLKEKLHSLQGNTNARGRRNNITSHANGSNLKEVMSSNGDNASTHSGQNEHTSGVSGLQRPLNKSQAKAYRTDRKLLPR